MTKIQFRVLYREFLFRLVDLELLSARGDISKLWASSDAVLFSLASRFRAAQYFSTRI